MTQRSSPGPTGRGRAPRPAGSGAMQRAAFAIALCLVAVSMTSWALIYFNADARRLPLLIGIPFVLIAIVNVLREWKAAPVPAADHELPAHEGSPKTRHPEAYDSGEVSAEPEPTSPTLMPVVWLAIATSLYLAIGLFPAATIFLAASLLIAGRLRWHIALVVTGTTVLGLYALTTLLSIPTYDGFV